MKKRGISLTTMSIMILIMLILVSTISVSITYSVTNAKKLAFAKEIYNIQNIVTEYIQREDTLPNIAEGITITPTDVTQFEGETFVDGKLNLNVIILTEIDIKNTNYGNKSIGNNDDEKAKDVYAVSETTGRVYYIAGFESNGQEYYTLTDELRNMIEKNQNINIGEKTVTFTPSKIGWANEGVSVTVFVPSEFTSPSITISNTNIAYTEASVEDGINYIVNSSKVTEDFTITVSYTKNGTSSSVTYEAKHDKVAPVISKDPNVANTSTHITGLNATDDKSGIKYFKYAEGAIEINDSKEYITAYGKNINKGNVKFENATIYTLYAEDKSGNYSVMYIDADGNFTAEKPVVAVEP